MRASDSGLQRGVKQHLTLVVALLSMLAADALLAAQTSVDGLRVRPSPERTRIVFDLGEPVEHKVFSLTDPHRLVIDISDASLQADIKSLNLNGYVK